MLVEEVRVYAKKGNVYVEIGRSRESHRSEDGKGNRIGFAMAQARILCIEVAPVTTRMDSGVMAWWGWRYSLR